MLKLRDVDKSFYRKELGNGRHTSFWYDRWSDRGVLSDLLGERGIMYLGVKRKATVEEAVLNFWRRRRHCIGLLNDIESELNIVKGNLSSELDDVSLWRRKSRFKHKFSTHETWMLLREIKTQCICSRGIWFSQTTPKFAFMVWLSILVRMSTLDRVSRWNHGIDTTCVMCKNAHESRNHLFFECSYSSQVWEHITKGVLRNSYTNVWSEILMLITHETMEKKSMFCIRYAFQLVLYSLLRERNKSKHGDKLMPMPVLKKLIDKEI